MKKDTILILHIFLIAVIGILAYSNIFNVPFVFDDEPNITENPLIRDLDNFIFPSDGYKGYLPRAIGMFSFALNYHYGGLDVTGYHVVNILIHIVNAILVYFLVTLTFKTPYFQSSSHNNLIPLFASLLFISHPIQTQAVTYIVQRLTSLATMFYLLSLVMYVKGRIMTEQQSSIGIDNGKRKKYWAITLLLYFVAFISAVFSMFTKEISFTLPIVIVMYEFFFFKSPFKKRLLMLLPFILTLLIIPLSILEIDKPVSEMLSDIGKVTKVQTEMSRWDYLMTQMRVITTYIRLIFLPINQNLDYDYPIYRSLFTPSVFLSFLFLLTIFGIGIYLFYRSKLNVYYRVISFGIFWFFITLSTESSIIPIIDVIFEHRVYLPSIGAFIAVTVTALMIKERVKTRLPFIKKAFIPAFAVIIIILSGATYARNMVWQSRYDLWADTAKKSPKKARALYNFGNENRKKGKNIEAIELYKQALIYDPNHVKALVNLGNAYSDIDDLENALKAYVRALQVNPEYELAYLNLAFLFDDVGKYADAIENFKKAISLEPDLIPAYEGLASIYEKLNRKSEAIDVYKQIIVKQPDHLHAHNSLGILYAEAQMYDEALRFFMEAIKIEPKNSAAYNNVGIIYLHLKNYDKAMEAFQKSIQNDLSNADAYNNLGNTYILIGRYKEAIDVLSKALQLKPDFDLAHYNIGVAYAKIGDHRSAQERYEILKQINKNEANELLKIIKQHS